MKQIGEGVGEVLVKASSMMQGYLRDLPDLQPIDTWPTGDLGVFDGEQSLSLVGRIKDIINLGGMKVDPAEVEHVLLAHACVADAAVYPGFRPNGDEFVQAAVKVAKRFCG